MAKDNVAAKLNKNYNRKRFTDDELDSIMEYTGSSFELFSLASMLEEEDKNKELIRKRMLLEKIIKLSSVEARLVPKIYLRTFDELLEKSSTSCNLVLYRGTSIKHFLATNLINNDPSDNTIKELDIYKSLIHVSASLDLSTAIKFVSKKDPLVIEYHLPKSYPALWVEPISRMAENELILKKNMPLKITKKDDVWSPEKGEFQYHHICVKPDYRNR